MEVLRDLLERAEKGEIGGLMHVISVTNGSDESGITGVYVEDSRYALAAAKSTLYRIQGGDSQYELPRRLRKDYRDEEASTPSLARRRR